MKKLFLSLILTVSIQNLLASDIEDDRVCSNDPRVGRIIFRGSNGEIESCTGWLTSIGCVLTSSHYVPQIKATSGEDGPWLEFNVPYSSFVGEVRFSEEKNRYRIIKDTIKYSDPSENPGNDWAIFGVEVNLVDKQSAFSTQGRFLRILDKWNTFNSQPVINVIGYSSDLPPLGDQNESDYRNRIQQVCLNQVKSEDVIPSTENSKCNPLYYVTPCNFTDYGSAVYLAGTHLAIAIDNGAAQKTNYGTGFKNTSLKKALINFCIPTPFVPAETSVIFIDKDYSPTVTIGSGDLFEPFRKLEDSIKLLANTSSNVVIGIVKGHYAIRGTTFPKAFSGKKIIFKALGGKVIIGDHNHNNPLATQELWCQKFSNLQCIDTQPISTRTKRMLAAMEKGVLWSKEETKITYAIQDMTKFPPGSSPAYIRSFEERERIIDEAFAEWNEVGMRLKFQKISGNEWANADIRIVRHPEKSDYSSMGSSSRNGKGSKDKAPQDSMNLGMRKGLGDVGRTTALHEIGHALGLVHEHQRADSKIRWNVSALHNYFATRQPVPVTDTLQVDRAVLGRNLFSVRLIDQSWDQESIRQIVEGKKEILIQLNGIDYEKYNTYFRSSIDGKLRSSYIKNSYFAECIRAIQDAPQSTSNDTIVRDMKIERGASTKKIQHYFERQTVYEKVYDNVMEEFGLINEFESLEPLPDGSSQLPYDSKSVMNYEFPKKCFFGPFELAQNGIARSTHLTELDKKIALIFYGHKTS